MKPIDCINEAKRLIDLRHELARQMGLTGSFRVEIHCKDGTAMQVTHGDSGSSVTVNGSRKRLDKTG